jgi:hypothetical protein
MTPRAGLAPRLVNLAPRLVNLAPRLVNLAPRLVNLAPPLVELAPRLVNLAPPLVELAPPLVRYRPPLGGPRPRRGHAQRPGVAAAIRRRAPRSAAPVGQPFGRGGAGRTQASAPRALNLCGLRALSVRP